MCCLAIYCYFFIYFVSHVTTEENMVSYAGAQVWRTNLRSAQDAHAIRSLADQQAISVWNMNSRFVDFLVQAAGQAKVHRQLRARGLHSSIIIEDVQQTLDELRPAPILWNENALRKGHRLDWKSYPTLSVIDEYLTFLAEMFPSLCNLTTIGHSVEKRPIQMIRISNGGPKNKAIMMTAGIHAREWIAITSALYLIDTLTTNFDKLPNYMKSVDWSIIPVLNPDGYEYSYTKDRLWRKNRQKTNSKCIGIDLNRNFGFNWYSPSKCADDYSGTSPFFEPETMVIRDLIQSSQKLPDAFIDVHSYGQVIIYPWSSKPDPPKNSEFLKAGARAMSQEILETTGKKYFFGDIYSTVYQASGVQADWLYSLGVNTVYGFEMRGGKRNKATIGGKGFLLKPEDIEPTGCDLVAAMRKLAEMLPKNKMTRSRTDHKLGLYSFLKYSVGKLSQLIGI